jgi:hypothetical protein
MTQQHTEQQTHQVQVTTRDLSVLRVIGEQYAVRFDQLQKLLGAQAGRGKNPVRTPGVLSLRAVRDWVSRMEAIEAVQTHKPYRGQPPYLWLTGMGLALAGLDFAPMRPAVSTFTHLYWCTQARLFMSVRRAEDVWIGERQLRREHAQVAHGKKQKDVPDAHLQTAKGVIAIEIELTAKQADRTRVIVRQRAAEYYTVWYFCGLETFARIEAAKQQLPVEMRERVHVYSLSQLE